MRARKLWLLLVPFLVLILPWVGIFKVEHHDTCSQCRASRLRGESFFWGISVSKQDFPWAPTLRMEIAEVLKRPCSHQQQTSWIRKRIWFGIYCANPCHCSITHLVSDWLSPRRREIIVRLAQEDPSLTEEFVKRGLLVEDREYFSKFLARVEEEEETTGR